MKIVQTILILINCSMCNAFQNLDDLEKFYKLRPAFDPFGASSKFFFNQSGCAERVNRPGLSFVKGHFAN